MHVLVELTLFALVVRTIIASGFERYYFLNIGYYAVYTVLYVVQEKVNSVTSCIPLHITDQCQMFRSRALSCLHN